MAEQPEVIIVEVPARIVTMEVQVPGRRGLRGRSGITVSATPPVDPVENDLWVDIS